MKKIIFTLIFCAFTAIASFAQTNAELIGQWKYHSISNTSEFSPTDVKMYEEGLKDMKFEFAPDQKYILTSKVIKDSGTWKIADRKIEFKSKDGKNIKLEVVKFEIDKLTVKLDNMVFTLAKITS